MSTLEVNTIKPISGSSTVTLGESGDTIALASGATAGFGKIGQVLQAEYGTAVTLNTSGFTDTGLSLAITPSATSSKILVTVNQNVVTNIDTNLGNSKIQLLRDSTTVISWGMLLLLPLLISLTITVPEEVPSLFHNSFPLLPSLALKYSELPKAERSKGLR